MTTIKLKNGSGAPTAGDLVQGEPALDLTNKRLYTEDSGGTVIEVGTNPGEDVTFADDRKAVFGAGSDLEIYHESSTGRSFIKETGADEFRILGSNIRIKNGGDSKTYMQMTDGGSVAIRHNDSTKLETTSSGIDVTGTVTSDGLTVDKANGALLTLNATNAGTPSNHITYSDAGGDTAYIGFISNSTDNLTVYNATATGDIELRTNALQRLNIDGATGDISFYEDTGTTAKLFWDASAESLGIGTSSPSKKLSIKADGGGSQLGIDIHNEGTATGDDAVISFETQGSREFTMGLDRSATSFVIAESSTLGSNQRLVIDDSGNVGINQTSPTRKLHVTSSGSGVVAAFGDSEANNTIEVTRTTTNASYVGLSATSAAGGIIAGPTFKFSTCDSGGGSVTERMRIDSSGNLLVGKTVTSLLTAGIALNSNGAIYATADAERPLILNRETSDGSIAEFRKDNSVVGSIGVASGQLGIDSQGTRLNLQLSGTTKAYVRSGSLNPLGDNTFDLGESSERFKDLYLSGGAYLGGTGSANLLDDYEEGTFTPELRDATSGGNTATTTHKFGNYTKVGNLVTIWMHFRNIDTTGMTSGNAISITGLPFTADNNMYTSGAVSTDRVSFSGNYLTFSVTENAAYGPISIITSNAQDASLLVSAIDGTGSDIQGICVQYRTA